MTTTTQKVLRVGLDLGTNSTVFQVSKDGKTVKYQEDVCPTIVGYSKPGILPGILPTDDECLFGEVALEYRLHLDLKWPLVNGYVADVDACKSFTANIRKMIKPGKSELWGVVGAPANASDDKTKLIRSVFNGVLERMLVVPEPFLAAMGLRDDEKAKEPGYVDPTKHSLIVDIGAGTTDCCLVQGYYPGENDQISVDVAGDAVDNALASGIKKRYPDIGLTRVTITKLKEANSFIGEVKEAKVKVYVDGKPRSVDFGALIVEACGVLVEPILESLRELFTRCDSESVIHVMQNIILAGGGSQINGLAKMLESRLHEEGYEDAKVHCPKDYQHLVAMGALKIANNVRDDQWQFPL